MARRKVKLKPDGLGVRCPRCNCADMRQENGWNVRLGRRRKRICRNCGAYVLTIESAVEESPEEAEEAEPK